MTCFITFDDLSGHSYTSTLCFLLYIYVMTSLTYKLVYTHTCTIHTLNIRVFRMTARILLLFFFCYTFHSIPIDASKILVAPNNNTKGCLENPLCTYFSAFVQHDIVQMIKSNTSILFYPGTHELQTKSVFSIVLKKLSNITIASLDKSKKAHIRCNEDFKVVWIIIDSANIHIEGLEMTECSALFDNQLVKLTGSYLSPTTLLFENDAKISIENSYLTDPKKIVVISHSTDKYLMILNCSFSGPIHIYYNGTAGERNNNTNILLKDSEFYSRGNHLSQAGGVIIKILKSSDLITVKTIKSYFFGNMENLFVLSLTYYDCNTLDIQLMDVTLHRSILKIGNSVDKCTIKKPPRVNINIWKVDVFSMSGLEVGSGLLSKKSYTKTVVHISNSNFIGARHGLSIFYSKAYITGLLFENSTAALKIEGSIVYFVGKNVFTKNIEGRTSFTAILFRLNTTAYIEGEMLITENRGNKYAAMIVIASNLCIIGSVHFIENTGFYGGALSLYSGSVLTILPGCTMTFIRNHALKSGGAIFVDTERYCGPQADLILLCFYRFRYVTPRQTLFFCNNTSVQGGDSLFGGSIDDCVTNCNTQTTQVLDLEVCKEDKSTSLISSDPIRLCFCNHTNTACDQLYANFSIIPGQSIVLSVVAVGQRYGTTIATARAKFIEESTAKVFIEQSQKRQLVERFCSSVRYTVHSMVKTHTLYLSIADLAIEDIKSNLEFVGNTIEELTPIGKFTPEIPLSVHLEFNECPIGYVFQQEILSCICLQPLVEAAIQCSIDNTTVKKSGNQWINATKSTLIVHKHCPYTYCKKEQIEFFLSDPNVQCAFNRAKTLCGQCAENLSHVLGTFNCQKCSNIWLLLIIPLTLVSGVILVTFTKSLNLTVALGTINGLILYANIVRANDAIFFSSQAYTITYLCSIFIAWVNLDLGVETCFYNGLDAYAKTIFQLAFPFYIFTLVGIIIVSSHYSTRAAKLSGNNSVQVLATLFLLSYSKLVRLVITVLSPISLTIQNFRNHTTATKLVWFYDGNLGYLQGRHIVLFLIGIVILLVLSLPYTVVLLFIQCLQKKSHHKCLSWVWKMKPLFDAYTGPYKSKYRYWTGLLLLLRVVLFTVYSLNTAGDPAINLLATAVVMLFILGHLVYVGIPYKSKVLGGLEFSFSFNLITLSITSLFAAYLDRGQEIVTNVSVLLSFFTFCGIVIVHLYKSIISLKLMRRWIEERSARKNKESDEDVNIVDSRGSQEDRQVTSQIVSLKDLKEPLLESTEETKVQVSQ